MLNSDIDLDKRYFGENTLLVCDEKGDIQNHSFRNRYYTILKNAGIETKGMHTLRHTFASNLVNGIKQADGTLANRCDRMRN